MNRVVLFILICAVTLFVFSNNTAHLSKTLLHRSQPTPLADLLPVSGLGPGEIPKAFGVSTPQRPDRAGDALLQFTTPDGHVAGIKQGSVIVAAMDHMLQVTLAGANRATPVAAETAAREGAGPSADPLSRVTYTDIWNGVTAVYEAAGGLDP